MAAYRRVNDSRHLQADCKNRDQIRNPMLGNRVWPIFLPFLHNNRSAKCTVGKIYRLRSDSIRQFCRWVSRDWLNLKVDLDFSSTI